MVPVILIAIAFVLLSKRGPVNPGFPTIDTSTRKTDTGQYATNQAMEFAAGAVLPGVGIFEISNLPQFGPLGEGQAFGSDLAQFGSLIELAAYNKTHDPRFINPNYPGLTEEQKNYILSLGYWALSPEEKDAIAKRIVNG